PRAAPAVFAVLAVSIAAREASEGALAVAGAAGVSPGPQGSAGVRIRSPRKTWLTSCRAMVVERPRQGQQQPQQLPVRPPVAGGHRCGVSGPRRRRPRRPGPGVVRVAVALLLQLLPVAVAVAVAVAVGPVAVQHG